jgi:hypothetical protein
MTTQFEKGGKGKKAPYQSTHARIPDPTKEAIAVLVREWKLALEQGKDAEALLVEVLEAVYRWKKGDLSQVKRYKLRGEDVIRVSDLEKFLRGV